MSSSEQDFVILGDGDVADFNKAGILPQSPETIEKIQSWLQPTDYSADSSEYRKHLASYAAGTGNWVQETPQYKQWMSSPERGALWIKAIPGVGKSVLAAQLASRLAKSQNGPVLYFFFRQIITTNQTPRSLVRDWMSQMLNYSPLLQSKLRKFLDDNRKLDSVAFDELWQVLLDALSSLPQVYCVVDALDEMNVGNESFLSLLVQLGQESRSSVKLLMTSRPVPRIEAILKDPSVLQIALRQQFVDEDIAIYVNRRLSDAHILQERSFEIQQTICNKAEGLFLYARLMMDDILESGKYDTNEGVWDILTKVPSGLGDMYSRMLLDHSARSGVSQQLQLLILKLWIHASRPLRLLELASIIDFLRSSDHPNLTVKATSVASDTKSIIRAACGPLLEILEDETVSIIHHSFTEFLTDNESNRSQGELNTGNLFPKINSTTAHKDMATVCIKYMISDWLDDWELSGRASRRNRKGPPANLGAVRIKNPFLAYASAHWHYHVSRYAKADEDLFSLLDVLLMPDSKAFLSWFAITCEDSHPGKVSPLHIAASKGLAEYATRLIRVGEDVNRVNPDRRTPLHCAAVEGHGEVAAILSSHGALKDLDDSLGFKPLHLAALSNRANIVKLLLEAGVDPFTPKAKEYPDGVAVIHLAQLARLLFSMLSNMDTWKPRVNSCHVLMPKV